MFQPERLYYPLSKAAQLLDCEADYLIHLAANGFFELCIKMSGISEDERAFTWNGYVDIEQAKKEWDKLEKDDEEIVDYSVNLKGYYTSKLTKVNLYVTVCHSDAGELAFMGSHFDFLDGIVKIPSRVVQENEMSLLVGDSCDVTDFCIPTTSMQYHCLLVDFEVKNYTDNGLEFIFHEPISVDVKQIIVTHEELSRLKRNGFPTFNEMIGVNKVTSVGKDPFDNPKTLSLLPDLTKALVTLIPNLKDLDVDNISTERLKEILEVEASTQNVEFPDIHHQTIGKYFGKRLIKSKH